MKKLKLTLVFIVFTVVGSSAQSWNLTGNNASDSAILGTNNNQSLKFVTLGSTRMTIKPDGNIGIGTTSTTGFKLSVEGKFRAREVFINLDLWADYVFDEDYTLMSIPEMEKYIQQHHHLPGIPSATEMTKSEVSIGQTQELMMRKIEELSLYIIQLNHRINELESK